MTRTTNFLLVTLVCLAAGSVLPAGAAAQGPPTGDCAACTSCVTCEMGPWGGDHCDFKGEGCECRERGGNCNPSFALNVESHDRRTIPTAEGELSLVRLTGETFGTWACDGSLTVAFRILPDGTMELVETDQLADLRNRYEFGRFVRILSEKLVAAG